MGRKPTKQGGRYVNVRLSRIATESLDYLMKLLKLNQSDTIERIIIKTANNIKSKNET